VFLYGGAWIYVLLVVSIEELGDRAHGDRFDHCEGPDSGVQIDGGKWCC
jgi:hypothetical protein